MITTYDEYQKMRDALSAEEMSALLQDLADEVGNDADALELWQELVTQAVKYAKFRNEWAFLNREQKMERDASRTACHDSLIVKFNMLARYLKTQGKPAKWRENLGDLKADPFVRKRIGDFGCYIVFINGLCAR